MGFAFRKVALMDPDSIKDFLTGSVLAVVIVVGAIVAASKWKAGGVREAAAIAVVTVVACLIVAVATHTKEVGNWIWKLIWGG